MSGIEVETLTKSWDGFRAVDDVTFSVPESGVDWSIVSAATLLSVAPHLVAFLLFQRQFVQSFMYAGIK